MSLGREVLSCRIKGFYPFPGTPSGPTAWFFREMHQGISVKTSDGSDSVFMDFMTKDGPAHPVWWDEGVKWQVLLGQNIGGEVRMRNSSREGGKASSKLERLRIIAANYDSDLNLYSNNCRIFCARMSREVERLNHDDADSADGTSKIMAEFVADACLAFDVVRAAILPMMYPASAIFICWSCLGAAGSR